MNSQKDSWMAVAAAILVLFTAMMDARLSSLLAVGLLFVFAIYKFVQDRDQRA